jgi:SH3-like domain-containing protein
MPSGAYLVDTGGHSLIIREESSVNSAMLGKIADGTVVLISKSVPDWSYVTYESVSGWVSSRYLMKF